MILFIFECFSQNKLFACIILFQLVMLNIL